MSPRSGGFAVLSLCILASMGFAQRVWVVATQPGSGVDFTEIQSAVTAAADGDVVLVRSGMYGSVDIRRKSLIVTADRTYGFGLRTGASFSISDIDASRSVVIRYLYAGSYVPRLIVSNCGGLVAIEDGTLTGVHASGCARAVFVRCALIGRVGVVPVTALQCDSSTVELHGCSLVGGREIFSGSGGDGCVLQRTVLHATGTNIYGGDGMDEPPWTNMHCPVPPGDGGDAIELDSSSSAALLACALRAGAAGVSYWCNPASSGSPVRGSGRVDLLSGPTGQFSANSPARSGSSWSVTVQGPPRSAALLIFGARSSPWFVGACKGTVYPDLTGPIAMEGVTVGPFGSYTLILPVPPSLYTLALPVVAQVLFATQHAGCTVGEPSFPLFLDARF